VYLGASLWPFFPGFRGVGSFFEFSIDLGKRKWIFSGLSKAGVAQLVEHHLAKVAVESSSLFARSIFRFKRIRQMTVQRVLFLEDFFVNKSLWLPYGVDRLANRESRRFFRFSFEYPV
jgi:hypothetical protein